MRRLAPAFAVFFLAPLVAEFFLGDFPITLLPLIFALAPLYGGAALLIREVTRRAGLGWPTIVVLALGFGVLEEALLTQSLFNPDYFGAHLLDVGFVPSLGIAIPWTIYVLTLHTVWSISTPIAIVEEPTYGRRTNPWLGTPGLVVTILLFVAGSIFTFAFSYIQGNHFLASPAQLGISAATVVLLVAVALGLPSVAITIGQRDGRVPNPWFVFAAAMATGAVFMEGGRLPVWIGVVVVVVALAGTVAMIIRWSGRSSWARWHRYALACAATLTYSWHAFTTTPVVGADATLNNVSHVIYAVAALGILWIVAVRIRRQQRRPSEVSHVERMVPSTSAPGRSART